MTSFGPTNEPLGLAYVDSSFERNKYDITIFDAADSDLCTDDISRKVKNENYHIIGITMITLNRAVREFYLRPTVFLIFIKDINSFSILICYTKGF